MKIEWSDEAIEAYLEELSDPRNRGVLGKVIARRCLDSATKAQWGEIRENPLIQALIMGVREEAIRQCQHLVEKERANYKRMSLFEGERALSRLCGHLSLLLDLPLNQSTPFTKGKDQALRCAVKSLVISYFGSDHVASVHIDRMEKAFAQALKEYISRR